MRADTSHSTKQDRDAGTELLRLVPTGFRAPRALPARRKHRRASWVLALTVVFSGVALLLRRFENAARFRAPMSDADVQAAIDAGNRQYSAALEAGDAKAYASVFTQDAVSMPARGQLIRGRTAIGASIADAFRTMTFSGGSLTSSQMRLDGDTAYELGQYAFDVASNGTVQHLTGRYLVIWRREGTDWKIAVDSSQPDVPQSAS